MKSVMSHEARQVASWLIFDVGRKIMFDSIKGLFGKKPAHEIVQCETKSLSAPDGPKHVLLLAANLHALSSQETLVRDLIERFKMQRMISPPDTSVLLVTVIGACDSARFLRTWKSIIANDQIAAVWMSKMEKADFEIAPASGNITPQFQSLL
jgi:hypothetical protein